jgi:ATP-dependent Zn protease
MSRPKRDEAIAYHEAGHAVVAHALGQAVPLVSFVPDEEDDSLGRCHQNLMGEWFRPDSDTSGRTRNTIEKRVIILFAGFHAEARFTGRRNYKVASWDRGAAADILSYLTQDREEELRAYLAWLDVRSKDMVNSPMNWRAIEYVARELLARRQLNGKDIRRLCQQARNDRD